MTATRVMIGIPKDAVLTIALKNYEDLEQTEGGDNDFIRNGKSLAEKSDFQFWVFTAHVVDKDDLLEAMKKAYPRFFYVQMTE